MKAPVELLIKNNTMKIWIGLQEPDKDFTGYQICEKANKMLKILGINDGVFGYMSNRYRKTSHDQCYFVYASDGSFVVLENNGRYFDLDDYRDGVKIEGEI